MVGKDIKGHLRHQKLIELTKLAFLLGMDK